MAKIPFPLIKPNHVRAELTARRGKQIEVVSYPSRSSSRRWREAESGLILLSRNPISVIEHELLRVQQRPEQVFDGLPFVRFAVEVLRRRGEFIAARQA